MTPNKLPVAFSAIPAAPAVRGLPGIDGGSVVAVVSGGDIDPHVFRAIMDGEVPGLAPERPVP